jgi:dTDP-4-amino-4,6-dideoxygalactose transaminase
MDAYAKLEKEFAKTFGLKPSNTVVCANGTAALHLALETLDIRPRRQVIVPEFTMVACARACTLADLRPVFVDCTPDLNLDVSKLPDSYTPSLTAAVMAVHVYGRPCDMEGVSSFARSRHLQVIEDLSEIHGQKPHPLTDAACWSFYRNKIIAGEEGGIIHFRTDKLAERARCLRSHGFSEAHDFLHMPRGTNYRMSNVHAKLVLGSLRALSFNLQRRKEIEGWYDEVTPAEWRMPQRKYPWVYDLRLPEGVDVGEVVKSFVLAGVPARQAFKPMSEQPEYLGHYRHLEAYRQSRRVMYLPITPDMTRERVREIAALYA